MSSYYYPILLILHLFAAIMFVGTVFFEVLILESLREPLGRDAFREVERNVGRRARRIMPFVILTLFGAGIGMAWFWWGRLSHPARDSFAILLWIKIVLATSVFGHFLTAMILGGKGLLRSRHTRIIHLSVFVHVILIVFLAKAMWYLHW